MQSDLSDVVRSFAYMIQAAVKVGSASSVEMKRLCLQRICKLMEKEFIICPLGFASGHKLIVVCFPQAHLGGASPGRSPCLLYVDPLDGAVSFLAVLASAQHRHAHAALWVHTESPCNCHWFCLHTACICRQTGRRRP